MLYAKNKHDNADIKCQDVPYIQLATCPSYLKAGYRISDVEFLHPDPDTGGKMNADPDLQPTARSIMEQRDKLLALNY